MADSASQPLQEFSPFGRFSSEIQTMIWKFAAEQHVTTFKLSHRRYERIWVIDVKHPYTRYFGRELTATEANAVRQFFPLLQATQGSRYVARQYLDWVHGKGQPAQLALKFVDKFMFEGDMIKFLINASTVSSEFLKLISGVENWTNTFTYPGVLGENVRQAVGFLSTVEHVAVPAFVFANDGRESTVCRQFLLELPRLKAVYVEHVVSHGELQSKTYNNIIRECKSYDGFLEMGSIRGGIFTLNFGVKARFLREYARRYDQLIGRNPTVPYTPSQEEKLDDGSEKAWSSQEFWQKKFMIPFLEFAQPFISNDIDCVIVANCAMNDGFNFPEPGSHFTLDG
ncbi:hypothetical protein GGR53DRAFT_530933 [Hypoxylon sp. FL1150]|nr:hypothetical protein GGR53DRAFT_530933 [Hypoxylon sp. FL1150]